MGFSEATSGQTNPKYSYLRINIGRRINPANWDKQQGRPTLSYSIKDHLRLHHYIEEQQRLMQNAIQNLLDTPSIPYLTTQLIKKEYEKRIGKVKSHKISVAVTEDIADYIQNGNERELTRTNYGGLLNQLKEFERLRNAKLYWHEFNQVIFDEFLDFLSKNNYKPTTLWGYQKRLLASFNRAKKRNLIPANIEIEKRFKYKTPHKGYLNWEQVAKVLAYKPQNEAMRSAHVHFTVLVLTGIRYNDLWCFYANYERGTAFDFSHFELSKTPNPEVLVPALLPIRKVMQEGIPSVPSNSNLNHRLKVLCAQVLPQQVAEHVTCHTLRRSFITNFLSLAIIPEHVIAMLTGHTIGGQHRVFYSYNKVTLFENAQVFVRLVSSVAVQHTGGLRLVKFVEQQLMN